MAKYYIYRESKSTGRVDVLRTKCTGAWCGERYLELHPDRVWKFSHSGAKKILDRETRLRGWGFKFWIEPAAE